MSGPIVRSGPSTRYTQNWEAVFAGKRKVSRTKSAGKPAAKKSSAKKKRRGGSA